MKTYSLGLVWLLGLSLAQVTFAQKQVKEPVFRHPTKNVVEFMRKYFIANYGKNKFLDTLCLKSVTYVKFRLDKEGKVSQVQCSVGTFPPLAAALEETVRFTSTLWEPRKIGHKAVESRDFLLPVLYNIGSSCTPEETKDDLAKGFWRMQRFEGSPQVLTTEINKHSGESLDCILLHPIYIQNQQWN